MHNKLKPNTYTESCMIDETDGWRGRNVWYPGRSVRYRWYYSIGDVTFIIDQEEENEWDMILKKKKEKQSKLGVER